MADQIAFKITVDTDVADLSVGELKQGIIDLTREINNTKVGTQQYKDALIKLGQTRGALKDLKDDIKALDPDAKFKALAGIGSSVASGFAAAQGAVALFGAESEDLQKTLVKVQAATALAQGINGLKGFSDSFRQFGLVLKANPIMLIGTVIVGIGTALYALRDKIKIVSDAFNVLGEALDWIVQKGKDLLDSVGISNFAADELKKVRAEKLKHMEWENSMRDAMREAAKAERLKEEEEAKKAAIKTAAELEKIRKRVRDKIKEEGVEDRQIRYDEAINTSIQNATFREQAEADALAAEKTRLRNEQTLADFRVMIQKESFKTIGELALAFAGKSEASQRRAFEINKAAGIAQTTVDTFVGAQKAYASQLIVGDPSSPVRAAIAAGFSIAAGLARVAIIAKTQFNSKGAGGGGGGGEGTVNAPNLQSPQSQQATASFSERGVNANAQGNFAGFAQPMKAYVVESEISRSQNTIKSIEERTTF